MSELFTADVIDNNPDLAQFVGLFDDIMKLPDESLNSTTFDMYKNVVAAILTPETRKQSINDTIEKCRAEGISRPAFAHIVEQTKTSLADYIDGLKPSAAKREMLELVARTVTDMFDEAYEQYNAEDFKLAMRLDPGAHEPTYAHSTDAAADLYALEDMVLPAHSLSNKVRTGVYIALPDRWMALILPRSSIGAKTGLRLSNSVGVIDSEYRGEIGVLYDNMSDSDYTIHAGDRIAQMLIMPAHSFAANVVDILPASDRGEGGFGSTGK